MAESEQSISLAGMPPLHDVGEEESDEALPGDQDDSGDDWDTDQGVDDTQRISKGDSGAAIYLQACKIVGVIPATYYLRNLGNSTLNMNHHGLGPKGTKALAIALVSDIHIKNLELEDNCLLPDGARYLVEMLKENFTIQKMNLSNNNLQTAGAEYIAKMLLDNIAVKALKLSGNSFIDEAAKSFADALACNFHVKSLDLSHNLFCEAGGDYLGHMLASNESLETLDLSWNILRMSGAVALCNGLKVNVTLKHLDLSYNGFGSEGAQALGGALRHNNTLLLLDLSSNRITDEAMKLLCQGLAFNDTLRVLRLLHNPISSEGALLLLTTVKNNQKSALEDINISTVVVSKAFADLLDIMKQDHPALDVQYQGVSGFFSQTRKVDALKVIQHFLEERKQCLVDFFKSIDKEGTTRVQASDLRRAIRQAKMPLDSFNIEVLIEKLDVDKTGWIDYRTVLAPVYLI